MIKLIDLIDVSSIKNKKFIKENIKQATNYVLQNKLTKKELEEIIQFTPDPKYVGWLAKIWINEHPDKDILRNYIEEYDAFYRRGKIKTKDIYQFTSFSDLKNEIDQINQTGENISLSKLEKDYDVILNNNDVLIMSPHTHEASRKLGLSHFAYRKCDDKTKDSAWCTTYKAPDHFNDYYYNQNVTFYYVKIKSENLINKIKSINPSLIVTALVVDEDGEIKGYDGEDKQIPFNVLKKYLEFVGIS